MTKKRFGKKLSQIDRLRFEFDNLTDDSKKKLQILMDAVIGGTAPEEKQIQDFKEAMTKLRDAYNKICAVARERLSDDELPPEGSPAKDFVEALNKRNAADLAVCREKALEIIKRFGRVRSDDDYYLGKLKDQKEANSEYAKTLEDPEEANAQFTETEDYEQIMLPAETFLKALDCEDLDSEEGIELLDKVSDYFSFNTAVGIMKKQYYISKYGW